MQKKYGCFFTTDECEINFSYKMSAKDAIWGTGNNSIS